MSAAVFSDGVAFPYLLWRSNRIAPRLSVAVYTGGATAPPDLRKVVGAATVSALLIAAHTFS